MHNGKAYLPLTVTEPMIGHKLGEFSFTKKYYDPPASKKSKAGSKRGATGRLK